MPTQLRIPGALGPRLVSAGKRVIGFSAESKMSFIHVYTIGNLVRPAQNEGEIRITQEAMPPGDNLKSNLQLSVLVDLVASFLFAVEGASAAVSGGLDFFGLMVLAFSTALVGGVVRDLLIGAVPPQAIRDWRYSAAAFTGAFAVFFLHRYLQLVPNKVMISLDAACLALVCRRRDGEGACVSDPSFHRHTDGNNYRGGWRHGARHYPRANSPRAAC